MKQVVRSVLVACLVVALGAGGAAQIPGLSAADNKELASYRLSMDTVNKVVVATRALFAEMKKDPKVQALMKTEAEIEALEKKEELTEAESERLEKLREQRDQQEEAVKAANETGDMSNAQTIDEMEAQIKKHPRAMAAFNQAGLSPREYSKFMMTMMMAGMIAGFQKSGMIKDVPKELKDTIHPDNVKFVLDHGAELEAMQKEFKALTSRGM